MRKKTEETINFAHTVIVSMNKPLHVGEIFAILVDAELFTGTQQSLYNLLYNQIRDAKQESDILFYFLGKGFFTSRSLDLSPDVDIVQPRPRPPHKTNYNRKNDLPGDKEVRIKFIQEATQNKKCGNCAYMRYKGVQAQLKEVGGCARYSDTKRACVYQNSSPCELWRIASLNQVRSNRRRTAA